MATTYNRAANPIWTFYDKTGKLATDGSIEFFRDTARSDHKDVFFDPTGLIPYPNPTDLDANGSIGPDLYFASDEQYYIEVRDQFGNLIEVFQNFNSSSGGSGGTNALTLKNYVTDGQFRFYYNPLFPKITATTFLPIAPTMWFAKDGTGNTSQIQILPFSLGQTAVPQNPINYLQFDCTVAGIGETFNDLYFSHGDVNTFENAFISLQLQGQSTLLSQISLYWVQNFGTGGAPSATVFTSITNFTLANVWSRQILSGFAVPTTGGKTLGTNNDAFSALVIRMPLNSLANVQITNVQTQLGTVASAFDYKNYEIETASTFGQNLPVPKNTLEGVIGGNNFNQSVMLDETQNMVLRSPIPIGAVVHVTYDATLFTEPGFVAANAQTLGTFEGVPGSIYRYFNLGQRLGLLKAAYGNGIDGFFATVPAPALPTISVSNVTTGSFPVAVDFGTTMTIVTTPGAVGVSQKTAVTAKAAGVIPPGTYFTIDGSGATKFYVWFKWGSVGIDPLVAGRIGVPIQLPLTATANDVANEMLRCLLIARFKLPLINNGAFIRGGPIDGARGFVADPDAAGRFAFDNTTVIGNVVGSNQLSQNINHLHNIGNPPGAAVLTSGGGLAVQAGVDLHVTSAPANTLTQGGAQANPYNIMCTALIKL